VPIAPLASARLQRAFTLIEMLVVMVIVSLLITVIMQGFGYSLGLYQRVVTTQKNAYTEVLAYNWLRTTLGSSVAARPKDVGLEGGALEVSTYTYQPLVEQMGLKTRISWRLVQDSESLRLEYREGKASFDVYQWPLATGRLEYMDAKKQWHGIWPAEKTDAPSLPNAIRIQVNSGQDIRNYVVSISTRKRPEVTMDEVLYGR
jgi:general secretion pathway protein J